MKTLINTAEFLCEQVEQNSVEHEDVWFAAESSITRELNAVLQGLGEKIINSVACRDKHPTDSASAYDIDTMMTDYLRHQIAKERLERAADILSGELDED